MNKELSKCMFAVREQPDGKYAVSVEVDDDPASTVIPNLPDRYTAIRLLGYVVVEACRPLGGVMSPAETEAFNVTDE